MFWPILLRYGCNSMTLYERNMKLVFVFNYEIGLFMEIKNKQYNLKSSEILFNYKNNAP